MPGHIHAALMAEYAKDAAETATPWERWEYAYPGHEWSTCSTSPGWTPSYDYRRKPRTITVGGREIEAPITDPTISQAAWVTGDGKIVLSLWTFSADIRETLASTGRVFASQQAAIAAYDAVTALLIPGGTSDES